MRTLSIPLAVIAAGLCAQQATASAGPDAKISRQQEPLAFYQAGSPQSWQARGRGYAMHIAPDAVDLRVPGQNKSTAPLRLKLSSANPRAAIRGEKQQGRINSYIGADPARWKTNQAAYQAACVTGAYPGIDMVYYGANKSLEFDFRVAPHANPSQIGLDFPGARSVTKLAGGALDVQVARRHFRLKPPVAYTLDRGIRKPVQAAFALIARHGSSPRVGFQLGSYSADRQLVIDPVIGYATYIGGSQSDYARGVAVDSSGSVWVTGFTDSNDLPTTNPSQATNGGQTDAFVARYSPSGALIFATYFGGPNADVANSVALDSAGNCFVAGNTGGGIPVRNAFNATPAGVQEGFLAKFSSTGQLLFSTYIGTDNVTTANGVAVDPSGNPVVAGGTTSTTFAPPGGGARVPALTGSDAYFAKVSSAGTTLIYAVSYGGTGQDEANGVAVDTTGNIYIAGRTTSPNLPNTGAVQPLNNGGTDAFLARFAPSSALAYSTYIGGTATDYATAVACDNFGNAYITGYTLSERFEPPVLGQGFPATPDAFQRNYGGGGDAFVARIDTTQTGAASLKYCTYYGGRQQELGTAIAVDSLGGAVITGYGDNNPQSVGHAIVVKFDRLGRTVLYNESVTGTGLDFGTAVAVGPAARTYVVGYSSSADLPVTGDAAQPRFGGIADGFLRRTDFDRLGDFNGDSFPDLVLQDPTGQGVLWFLQGSHVLQGVYLDFYVPNFRIAGAWDFNYDGHPDFVVQNTNTGDIALWYSNNRHVYDGEFLDTPTPPGLIVKGAYDFNGDGLGDLVLQDGTTGQVQIWICSGPRVVGQYGLDAIPPPGMLVTGVADFNRDGSPDLLLQDKVTGQVSIWYLSGAKVLGTQALAINAGPKFQVVGTADIDADGNPDILLQNIDTGVIIAWYMNGAQVLRGETLDAFPGAFRVRATR